MRSSAIVLFNRGSIDLVDASIHCSRSTLVRDHQVTVVWARLRWRRPRPTVPRSARTTSRRCASACSSAPAAAPTTWPTPCTNSSVSALLAGLQADSGGPVLTLGLHRHQHAVDLSSSTHPQRPDRLVEPAGQRSGRRRGRVAGSQRQCSAPIEDPQCHRQGPDPRWLAPAPAISAWTEATTVPLIVEAAAKDLHHGVVFEHLPLRGRGGSRRASRHRRRTTVIDVRGTVAGEKRFEQLSSWPADDVHPRRTRG